MSSQINLCFTIIFAHLIFSIFCAIVPRPVNNVVSCKHLTNDLQPGDIIVIKGTFSEVEYRTNIDLENRFKCKWEEDERKTTDPDCIVAFQNSIRFDEEQIVRNSYKNLWENGEERYGEFPFKKGHKFIYKILVKEDHFDVDIDGKSFTLFKFRTPLSDIKYITIYGTSDIDYLKVEKENESKDQITEPLTINNETASMYLGNDLQPGNVITIKGHFLNDSLTTNIDLENEYCKWKNYRLNSDNPDCLVAFHSSIRFNERKIVRSIFKNKAWAFEGEERHGIFPFENRQNFVFKIIVKEDHFEVEIDGDTFTTFNFRMPLTEIKYVKVYGNAVISSISVDLDISRLTKIENCVPDIDVRLITTEKTNVV